MKIRVILTGATGMIGRAVLQECLHNNDVESILVIGRRSCGTEDPRLKEILLPDLADLSPVIQELGGYNACFFCLGVSSAGLSEETYHKITFDLTLRFATALKERNPGMCFCYISGAGTDSTEKGRSMWARVKGRTENALLSLGFKSAYMFRPGMIIPLHGIRSRTLLYNVMYGLMRPFYPLLIKKPKYVTDTDRLSRAMIRVASEGYESKILESLDINRVAEL